MSDLFITIDAYPGVKKIQWSYAAGVSRVVGGLKQFHDSVLQLLTVDGLTQPQVCQQPPICVLQMS